MSGKSPGKHGLWKSVSAVLMFLTLLSGCTPMGNSLFAVQADEIEFAVLSSPCSSKLPTGLDEDELPRIVRLINEFRYTSVKKIDDPFYCYYLRFERAVSEDISYYRDILALDLAFCRDGIVLDGYIYQCRKGYLDELVDIAEERYGPLLECKEGTSGLIQLSGRDDYRIVITDRDNNHENQIVYENPAQVSAIVDLLNDFCYYDTIDYPDIAGGNPYSVSVEVPSANSPEYISVFKAGLNRNGLLLDGEGKKICYLAKFGYFTGLVRPFEIGEAAGKP